MGPKGVRRSWYAESSGRYRREGEGDTKCAFLSSSMGERSMDIDGRDPEALAKEDLNFGGTESERNSSNEGVRVVRPLLV